MGTINREEVIETMYEAVLISEIFDETDPLDILGNALCAAFVAGQDAGPYAHNPFLVES